MAKAYLLSLAVGLLVGAIYALLNVRSPAPPAIALLGLLGMLLGEQAVPVARRLVDRAPAATPRSETPPLPAATQAADEAAAP